MEAVALRTCKWSCNGTTYELIEGKTTSISSKDEAQAKASGLFKEVVKPIKTTKAK